MTAVVVDLTEFRRRRWLQQLVESRALDEYDAPDEMRGYEPSLVVVDEVHHWTSGWEHLLEEILRPTTAFRREWLNTIAAKPGPSRRLRILRGTDHGSDDGDAESHQGDDRLPRC